MLKSIAGIVILLFSGLLGLTLSLVVVASLSVSFLAVAYRLMPGPNVPLRYNLRNTTVRWINTVVTAAAFTCIIAMMVVMHAFVTGMYRLTEGSAQPGNVVVLQDGSTDESFSSLPPTAHIKRLPEDQRKGILMEGTEFVVTKECYVVVNQPIPGAEKSGKQNRFVQMRGVDNVEFAAKIHAIELQEGGRWISQQGVQKITGETERKLDSTAVISLAGITALAAAPDDRAIEVVVGAGIAKELGKDRAPFVPITCGEILAIGGRKWIVVGIMSAANASFASEVWCRDYLLQEQFGRRHSYTSYVVATTGPQAAQRLSKDLKDFKELAVNALPETEYYANLNATNQQFLVAIIVVTIIMAVGGVLGVMITMFAAISARSKDIGVLRLLGYTRWQILVSFLLESLVIAFVGGILGCAIGSLCHGITATSIVSSAQGGGKSVILQLTVSIWSILAAMILTFIMGSVGGVVPALSAMRLKPLESLR